MAKMKFMKLGSKPDTFQTDGDNIRYEISFLSPQKHTCRFVSIFLSSRLEIYVVVGFLWIILFF